MGDNLETRIKALEVYKETSDREIKEIKADMRELKTKEATTDLKVANLDNKYIRLEDKYDRLEKNQDRIVESTDKISELVYEVKSLSDSLNRLIENDRKQSIDIEELKDRPDKVVANGVSKIVWLILGGVISGVVSILFAFIKNGG